MGQTGSEKRTGGRRYEIDWLRVLAMLTIFLFHCAMFFNYDDWHVKNNNLSFGMSVFAGIVVKWIMPLFFVLSAIALYYSLARRTAGQFIRERLRRLAVPLIFGTFVFLVPVQVWIERVSHLQYEGSFVSFYPHYFEGFYGFGGNFAWMGLHLWYLEALFLFSFVSLPLLRYLRGKRMAGFMERLAFFCRKHSFMLIFAVPVFISEIIVGMQPEGIGLRAFGGWSIVTYFVFFLSGYAIATHPVFMQTMEDQRHRFLVIGTASIVLLMLMYFGNTFQDSAFADLAEPLFRALASWCSIVAILGFGRRYLKVKNRILAYANEAVLPFYVLHQTVIVMVGFYIKDWNAGIAVKYVIISTVSFAVIVAFYHLFIRRFNPLRFLFGLKPV